VNDNSYALTALSIGYDKQVPSRGQTNAEEPKFPLRLRIPFKLHKFKSTTTEKAVNILKVRREVLEQGAQLLLQNETLVEEDLKALKGTLPAMA